MHDDGLAFGESAENLPFAVVALAQFDDLRAQSPAVLQTKAAQSSPRRNRLPTGTLRTADSSPQHDRDLDAIAIAEVASLRAGLPIKSISTLTRCSSTPSAETLVNPDGSTRRTRAVERLAAAPLVDAGRGRRG